MASLVRLKEWTNNFSVSVNTADRSCNRNFTPAANRCGKLSTTILQFHRFKCTANQNEMPVISSLDSCTSESPASCSMLINKRSLMFLSGTISGSYAYSALSSSSGHAAIASPEQSQLVSYVPNLQKTPALRAGLIREPYNMFIPASWKEAKIPNILSGNFCMPNCDEPWTEAIFEDPAGGGKVQLIVSPLVKLTNKVNAPIQTLGSPESLLPRIGGYITGTYFEEDDLLTARSVDLEDGRTYYYYELFAPSANGHSLTAVTTKGEGCYLLVANASNEKAWAKLEPTLRNMVNAFRA
ncbi:hypothetical protein CEUSTIGMA_g9401.t1 [Chlamydomonas eustigma]|uniref:PsbP C-terminal domain-containing protein n=1 Tax=Chlamydomonas eustigma TaxID=1157962 RepID=A0A250XFZ3_9CHLO|nr:hypothetical protein CEUSTIGMA_g9401.t1 [Chlamydomonas eustigma]|eukprot:GAX81973.1 hypothetical protein CEUSTIGMA_g9401.t1 [Chlamydomonas eustigma]